MVSLSIRRTCFKESFKTGNLILEPLKSGLFESQINSKKFNFVDSNIFKIMKKLNYQEMLKMYSKFFQEVVCGSVG